MTKHDVEIRRYLAWRRKVRGKTIPIRLYELIYVGLTMLWSKMEKPPLKTQIPITRPTSSKRGNKTFGER